MLPQRSGDGKRSGLRARTRPVGWRRPRGRLLSIPILWPMTFLHQFIELGLLLGSEHLVDLFLGRVKLFPHLRCDLFPKFARPLLARAKNRLDIGRLLSRQREFIAAPFDEIAAHDAVGTKALTGAIG